MPAGAVTSTDPTAPRRPDALVVEGDPSVDAGDPTKAGDDADDAASAARRPAGRRAAPPVDGLDATDRRRLRRAWWCGALPALAAYLWVITVGRFDLFQRHYFDDFFDAQARSLMDGRLDVPAEVATFEGFLIDGRTFIYFGPVPALVRMPVLAVTDRFDGRLTTVSMLIATVILAIAAFRLLCVLRAMVRGGDPVGRREPLLTGLLAVVVLVSPPFFLASEAVVYHEATTWGLALSVAGFDAVARWQRRPSARGLVVASALIAGALLSRQTLGLGPLVALALSGLAHGVHDARREDPDAAGGTSGPTWTAWPRRLVSDRRLQACALACALPLVASIGLNFAKFGTLLSPPSDKHNYSLWSSERDEVLAANDGTLFGLQFAPTTLKQYFRPDGIDVRLDMPWIDFPRLGPSLVGEATFDKLDWTSSIPASAPALSVLTVGALVWAVRTRGRRRGGPWLSPLVLGAAAGGFGVIAFGYIANRYLTDLFPLVLVPGMIGFHLVLRGGARRPARTRRTAAVALAGLAALGVLVNPALALEYQRERGPRVDESTRAQWVSWRSSLPGAYEPVVVPRGQFMPQHLFDGRLAIVGECDGMYVRLNDGWHGVERGPDVGVHDLRVDIDALPPTERVPLLTLGDDDRTVVVAIRRVGEGRVRVDVSRPSHSGGGWRLGWPKTLSGTVTIRVDADGRVPDRGVWAGSEALHGGPLPLRTETPQVGVAPPGLGVADASPEGAVQPVPYEPELCDRDEVRDRRQRSRAGALVDSSW
jgi:hypothetical protein